MNKIIFVLITFSIQAMGQYDTNRTLIEKVRTAFRKGTTKYKEEFILKYFSQLLKYRDGRMCLLKTLRHISLSNDIFISHLPVLLKTIEGRAILRLSLEKSVPHDLTGEHLPINYPFAEKIVHTVLNHADIITDHELDLLFLERLYEACCYPESDQSALETLGTLIEEKIRV